MSESGEQRVKGKERGERELGPIANPGFSEIEVEQPAKWTIGDIWPLRFFFSEF